MGKRGCFCLFSTNLYSFRTFAGRLHHENQTFVASAGKRAHLHYTGVFNTSGRKVAELKDFTSKLVRDAELINTDRKTAEKSPEKAGLPEVAASLEGGHPHEEAERYVMNLMAEKSASRLNRLILKSATMKWG